MAPSLVAPLSPVSGCVRCGDPAGSPNNVIPLTDSRIRHIACPDLRTRFTSLLTPDGYSPKTDKGHKYNVATAILYLAPSDESGALNTCQHASAGCRHACLFRSGRGEFDLEVNAARVMRTRYLKSNRAGFAAGLVKEITSHRDRAARKGMECAVRLNGTSDLPWERFKLNDGRTVFETFPDVQFYDYTKDVERALAFARGEMPSNYDLTFSRSETNDADAYAVLAAGGRVAFVFDTRTKHTNRPAEALPTSYAGIPVVDGDETDLRFRDPAGVIVGLRAKGKRGRADDSGFVVPVRHLARAA